MSTPASKTIDPNTPLDPTNVADPTPATDTTADTTAEAPEYVAAPGDVVATDGEPPRYGIVVAVGDSGPEVAFLPPAGAYGLALRLASDVS